MPDSATQILEEATPRRELVGDNLRAGADWFHENEGELFERDEALSLLQQELDVDEETASAVLAELAGDTVDPIVHIPSNGSKHYGVVEYEEFQGAYGYVDYHDVFGKRKRVVCAKCVEESTVDSDVAHATAGDHSGQFADQPEADYDELLDAVQSHYIESHGLLPEEVKTGASLVSGTTIGGNTSWHSGNDGGGSGLDADTLDGVDSSQFLRSDQNDKTTGQLFIDNHGFGGSASIALAIGDSDTGLHSTQDGTLEFWSNSDADAKLSNGTFTYGGSEIATQSWANSSFDNYGSWTIEEGDGEQTSIGSGQKLEIYGGSQITTEITSTGGESRLRVDHANTTSQGDVTTGGATVIDDLYIDGNGHVDNINTQNRSLDDWGSANANINMGNNNINNINGLHFSDPGEDGDIAWQNWNIFEAPNDFTNSSGNLQVVHQGTRTLTIDSNNNVEVPNGAYQTSNFEVRENSSTNSLDFNYTGS